MRRSRAVALVLICGGLLAAPARANLAVDNLIVDLGPADGARKDLTLTNNGKERLYVLVTPREVLKPGTKEERRVERFDPKSMGLLVTPRRIVLEPGQVKAVRVIGLGRQGSAERIYRLEIKPVTGKVSASRSGVKVLFGYNVLVMRRPQRIIARLEARRERGGIRFINRGNANVALGKGRQCAPGGKPCEPVRGKRIYPGGIWFLPLRRSWPVSFEVDDGASRGRRAF